MRAKSPGSGQQKRKFRFSEQCAAYHEAGHAVAAFFLKLAIGRRGITIVPDRKEHTVGTAHILHQLRSNPEYAVPPRARVRIETIAIMLLAGDAAERKFSRHRRYGGGVDLQRAVDLLEYISISSEVVEARLKVASLEASALVACRWEQIIAVAAALTDNRTLTSQDVRSTILRTIRANHSKPH